MWRFGGWIIRSLIPGFLDEEDMKELMIRSSYE